MSATNDSVDSAAASEEHRSGRREFLIKAGIAAGALAAPSAVLHASALSPVLMSDKEHRHGEARPFVCKNEPHRVRKSFYDLTEDEVKLLCQAIGYMRNGSKAKPLSVDSPVQWDRWVLTHARHCTEAVPGKNDQVHWSWFFLPWHRAYLWMIERQLANIVTTQLGGDGSKFAIPYWDWLTHKEIPNTRQRAASGTPSPLFGFDLTKEDMVNDDGLGFDNQALWNGYRKPTIAQPTMDPANERSRDSKEHIEETMLYMGPQYLQYMLELDFEDFAGTAIPSNSAVLTPDGMGALEHYPHNNGHDWVGSRFGKNRDMGTLRYAALDPIFFMHHANLDRVWSFYRGIQPDPDTPWGPNKYVWGKQSWPFIDIDGSPVTISVADVIKCLTNVTYAEPSSPAAAVAVLASTSQRRRAPTSKTVLLSQQSDTLTTKPLTLKVSSPPTLRQSAGAKAANPLSLLVIETGAIPYTGKFSIKVFIDKPDADRTTSTHDPHYVGRIRALDSDARTNERGPNVTHTFSIIIPPGNSNFRNLVGGAASFNVSLVPAGPRADDATFRIAVKSIRLKTVE